MEVTPSWIFFYYGFYALLYQWRLHAAGHFVIMDIMPSHISGGHMQLVFCYYGYYALLYQLRSHAAGILLLWILCPPLSVEDTVHAAGYFVIMDSMPSYISGGYMQLIFCYYG